MSARRSSASRDRDRRRARIGERRAPPLAFVIDGESSIRRFVSLVLQGGGLDTLEFADSAELQEAGVMRAPDLVFLDVNVDVQDALPRSRPRAWNCLHRPVQLMSGRGAAVLETVRQAGEQYGLRMLPVLKKPFETSAIQKIICGT